MTNQATKYVVGLGLLAGSLAIAPESYAQIQVTGGEANGEAAFFIPTLTPEGNVRLFDANIQELRIETPNGVTTTSVFTPNAADFDDANRNGLPDRGDTGTLQGFLTGFAFTQTGSPIAFSNRPTLLNFTLNDFTANIGLLNGTLIRSEVPGEAPLVFLPGVDSDTIQIDSDGLVGDGGTLQIGEFSSTLDDGVIALPPNLIFRDSNGVTPISPVTLARRIKFDFQGEDVIPDVGTDFGPFSSIILDDDDSVDGGTIVVDDDVMDDDVMDDDVMDDDVEDDDDSIRFVGEVNQRFRIQSIGTQANQEFKIFGSFGSLDLTLGNISEADIKDGDLLSELVSTDYRVRGDSEGIFSFFGDESYSFASTGDSDTRFEFEQGANSLEGRSEGNVNFYAASGLGTLPISDGVDVETGSNVIVIDTTVINLSTGSTTTCNFCGNTLVNNSTVNIDNTVVRVGQPVVVNVSNTSNSSSETTINQTINQTFSITNNISFDTVYSANSDLFGLSGSTPTALYIYSFLSAPRFYVLSDYSNTISITQISIDVINQGTNRYYLVMNDLPGRRLALGRQRDNVLAVYRQVGPDSRIFPGLVGLREIDVDELDDEYFDDDISLDDNLDDSDESEDIDSEDTVDSVDDSDDSDDSVDEVEDNLDDSMDEMEDDTTEESIDDLDDSDEDLESSVDSTDSTEESVDDLDTTADETVDSADDSTEESVEDLETTSDEPQAEPETVDGIEGLEEL